MKGVIMEGKGRVTVHEGRCGEEGSIKGLRRRKKRMKMMGLEEEEEGEEHREG